jgi:hypothetical protein
VTSTKKSECAWNPRDNLDTQGNAPSRRKAGREVLESSPAETSCRATMRSTIRTSPYMKRRQTSQTCAFSSLPSPSQPQIARWIGLAGLCLFAKVAAPLPAYAQNPLDSSEASTKEGKQMAPTPPADGPKARDPEARKEARNDAPNVDGSEPPSREEASPAQRVAQLLVAERRSTAPEPSGASAEPSEPASAAAKPASAAEPVRGEAAGRRARSEGGKRKISLEDEFLIEGKLEKPSAYYILRRSTLDYDWARLDARFSPLVLESVQDPLF